MCSTFFSLSIDKSRQKKKRTYCPTFVILIKIYLSPNNLNYTIQGTAAEREAAWKEWNAVNTTIQKVLRLTSTNACKKNKITELEKQLFYISGKQTRLSSIVYN